MIESFNKLKDISDHPIFKNNHKKSLLVERFKETWYRDGLIIQSDKLQKFNSFYFCFIYSTFLQLFFWQPNFKFSMSCFTLQRDF